MTSRRDKRFDKAFAALPAEVQDLAREAYKAFRANPYDPALGFHRIRGTRPNTHIMAVDVGRYHRTTYRALGLWNKADDVIVWFWIGTHEEYNGMIS